MIRNIYRITRSILFTVTLVAVGLFVAIYILLSIPAFSNYAKNIALKELSDLLGADVEVGELSITPFNEVLIKDLKVFDPLGQECIEIETLGAGISLWKLLTQQKIELTYGEIIGLRANLIQEEKGGPLNINFIIEAFSKKDDNNEKKPFELALRNVVLRKSFVSFQRPWLDDDSYLGRLNLADISITNLAADITFPRISDQGIDVDLRRLSFEMPGMTEVEKIAVKGSFGRDGIKAEKFELKLPDSRIFIPAVDLPLTETKNLKDAISSGEHSLIITESYIDPADFSFLFNPLKNINYQFPLHVDMEGNLNDIVIKNFNFGDPSSLSLIFRGNMMNLSDPQTRSVNVSDLDFKLASGIITTLVPEIKGLSNTLIYLITHLGNINLQADIEASQNFGFIDGSLNFLSDAASIVIEGKTELKSKDSRDFSGEIRVENLMLAHLLPTIPVNDINAQIVSEGELNKGEINGALSLLVESFELKNKFFQGFSLEVEKTDNEFSGSLEMDNSIGNVEADFAALMEKDSKAGNLNCSVKYLDLSEIIDMKNFKGYLISGNLSAHANGSEINETDGELNLTNLSFHNPEVSKSLNLKKLALKSERPDSTRLITLSSDWLEGEAEGNFNFSNLKPQVMNLVSLILPALIPTEEYKNPELSDFNFQLSVKPNNSVPEFFNLPIRLLVPISIEGNLSGISNNVSLALDAPYLQQGKDKLIYDSRLFISIDGNSEDLEGLITTTMPVKKGDLRLNINLFGDDDRISTEIGWENTENHTFNGILSITGDIAKDPFSRQPVFNVDFKKSNLSMGEAEWILEPATIRYGDKKLEIEDFRLWHDNQFVEIEGIASPEFEDIVSVRLADIDVDYIFDMLQINYVTFGGIATGEVVGRALFSSNPVAETESLHISEFSYNGAKIGECEVSSRWDNPDKKIEINADISHDGEMRVIGRGGIWLGRDSLAFGLKANKVPVDFIQPFMAVFSSHVGGFATGDINLFGTFKDIDMTGQIFADSVAIKLDYTNTIYHGSDSVLLYPGRIEIPSFRLYDRNGNSAILTGELTHRFFHDPSFTFRLNDAVNFLCYDTSAELNPDWYGVLYGSGSALLHGVPGVTDISADMTITDNSTFTFVLNDTQYAQDYQFLTFSDRRAEEKRAAENQPVDFKALFKKRKAEEENGMSKFGIDIRATVTPAALFTLVMDPAAGDKITARGRGAMQVKYESDNDEMQMYGKYEIAEGNYNFSLQDIILRDFKIKEGSYISFNGNPLRADLDISAAYRVNTNLSDLDKSFSSDRDLARTNVPVDAILSVSGNMQQPDITFDIELPTLTQDVERKVKSIISTDDMMNRQIIYLLALNRFYTPEYMGVGSNGGELAAAVASSTISSQLSNMLGQLTDKVSVSPSFRSDKGDFSDIEVDVALSSRLLNNRLLINGNFGYRDRNNSSTTFVGDFDVEYLLSKNGNLRLKAYNHFNDQNYYLREALTTQGLGIVWRRDFDNFFRFKKKEEPKKEDEE